MPHTLKTGNWTSRTESTKLRLRCWFCTRTSLDHARLTQWIEPNGHLQRSPPEFPAKGAQLIRQPGLVSAKTSFLPRRLKGENFTMRRHLAYLLVLAMLGLTPASFAQNGDSGSADQNHDSKDLR